ncbi:MAG: hypothetical protein L6R39_003829 [Caloplaca ligustica]|nr:MAG: hypothetical protein L6R39_003829 [Caloplaca ligustica]
MHSQANATDLHVPPSFKVDIAPDVNSPVDVEEAYRTAVDMMFVVSDYALSQTWLDRAFTSPIGDARIIVAHASSSGKDPSRLTTQHVIWGLNHLMLSMTLSRRYCRTVATLKWDDVTIGTIKIVAHKLELDSSSFSSALQLGNNITPDPRLTHFFDRDVTIQVAYGRKPIDRKVIYLTAIRAMGDAAEKGLDTPCRGMLTTGIQQVTWKLLREPGSQVPILRAGHSRIAVFSTLGRMLLDQRFQEIHLVMKVEGDQTAVGGFHQGPLRATTS